MPEPAGKSLAALMFTDIVGSVSLQQQLGTAAYTRLIARHDEVFKACLELVDGAEILNETGDGFLVRFADPADAVTTALRLQHRFAGEDVDGQPIRVRIGLHMGIVTEMTESVRGDRRVVGMPINIAARVMDLGGGGQILMTHSVYDDARHHVRTHPADPGGEVPAGPLRWLAHGRFELKGGDEPVEVFEVGLEGLAPLTPPAGSAKARPVGAPDVGASPEAPAAEPITPEEIEKSDVLISYAPVDDLPLAAGGEGWVTRLHRNLAVRLEQLCGERIDVVRCPRDPASELPDSVISSVRSVKTMVPVVSPPFFKSDKCCNVVASFGEGASAPGVHKELVKAVKTPVASDDLPERLAPVLRESLDYNFYDEDPEDGRVREFDEAFGTDAQKRYYERVYDLAFEVSKNVKASRRQGAAEERGREGLKTVFLAEATSDLQEARDRLRRELLEEGHTIVPDKPLPTVAEALEAALARYLAESDYAIHFIGGRYGLVPDGASESLAVIQNRAAARRSAEAGLARVVWVPRDVVPGDDRQAAFLDDLAENAETHRGAEVIRDTIENIKDYIRDSWRAEEEARRKAAEKEKEREKEKAKEQRNGDAAGGPAANPRLYLICDSRDEAAVEPIEDYFFDQGVEVLLPEFAGDESAISEIHWGNLSDCDAVLVYYGAAGKSWVDYKLRELVKAAGYREGRAIAHQLVYVAPPFDRRKERFRSLSAEVARQTGDAFEPAALEAFAGAVKAGAARS